MTEGCHGGWGLFYGMFLESYYTVNERDAPYQAKTREDGCKAFKGAKKTASVESTYYVGGAYGKMNELMLMKEILARGPVLYDFNAGREFMTYSSGILMETGLPHGCQSERELRDTTINTKSQIDAKVQYQKLTHSTLVVGWGEEVDNRGELVKYWVVRNSYGGRWGEGGYFRVRRGNNDFGGEGENSAVLPICWDCSGARRADGYVPSH